MLANSYTNYKTMWAKNAYWDAIKRMEEIKRGYLVYNFGLRVQKESPETNGQRNGQRNRNLLYWY